jgi:hypothetical protein
MGAKHSWFTTLVKAQKQAIAFARRKAILSA